MPSLWVLIGAHPVRQQACAVSALGDEFTRLTQTARSRRRWCMGGGTDSGRRRSTSDPLCPRPQIHASVQREEPPLPWFSDTFSICAACMAPQHVLSPTDGRLPAVLGIFYDNVSNYAGPTVELHLHHIRCVRNLECDQAEEEKVLSVQRGSGRNDCRLKRKWLGFRDSKTMVSELFLTLFVIYGWGGCRRDTGIVWVFYTFS